MVYVKQAGCGHLLMEVGGDLVCHLLYQCLIVIDGEWDKPIYQLRVMSLKFPDISLHYMESGAPMIVICVLIEATCS